MDREILISLLRATGLSDTLVEFLYDYLAPRLAAVVVQGHESKWFRILNEVFQGTVLGPSLWNIFFASIDGVIRDRMFRLAKFADDMSAYKNYENTTTNDAITADLKQCQHSCHEWGAKSRVTFDTNKKHSCILHRHDGAGEAFRLLGTVVDHKFTMEIELRRTRSTIGRGSC